MNSYLESEISSLIKLWGNPSTFNSERIEQLGNRVLKTFSEGGLLAFAGNGGSAAEASHLAAEFIGRCVKDHLPLPALNLGESVPSFSATTNDYSFDDSLVRSSQALLNSKSIIIALSTSGTSSNIVKLIEDATSRGIYTILWTSSKFTNENLFKKTEIWIANTNSTPRAQEVHLMWGHLLSEYIEYSL